MIKCLLTHSADDDSFELPAELSDDTELLRPRSCKLPLLLDDDGDND